MHLAHRNLQRSRIRCKINTSINMANGLTIAQDMTETQQKGSFQFCQANSPQVFAQND